MAEPSDSNEPPAISEAGGSSQQRILYPIFQSESDIVLHLAAALADVFGAELIVGYVDAEDDQFSYDTSRDTAHIVFETKIDSSIEVPVHGHTLTGSNPLDAVVTAADRYRINSILSFAR